MTINGASISFANHIRRKTATNAFHSPLSTSLNKLLATFWYPAGVSAFPFPSALPALPALPEEDMSALAPSLPPLLVDELAVETEASEVSAGVGAAAADVPLLAARRLNNSKQKRVIGQTQADC